MGASLPHFELASFATADELAKAVAEAWLKEIEVANRPDKRCYGVALSGGRIAGRLFASAVEQAKARNVPLRHVHFFWADERCVPPDDADSNFRVAQELLFRPLAIRESQIHRIPGEDPPEMGAAKAEADLCHTAPLYNAGRPVLDLVLLGMGEDGHVASLFPGEREELKSSKSVYRAITNSPKPPPNRITLGYPAIAAAQKVWVLASGAGKEDALRDSLTGSGDAPLARVLKLRRETRIYTDIALRSEK
jgi:6-phosphogluconolactonase